MNDDLLDNSLSNRIDPYVGITGVQSVKEVTKILTVAREFQFGPGCQHNLMLGALVSGALIRGEAPLHSTKPYRHVPNLGVLREILRETQEAGAIPMLHFELHKEWPGTRGDAAPVIELLDSLQEDGLSPAVQLNGVVFANEVEQIFEKTHAALVIQLRDSFTAQPEDEVLEYLAKVQNFIAMILVDPSAGTGQIIDCSPALSWHRALSRSFPDKFSFGFAGGFGGDDQSSQQQTVNVVSSLHKNFGPGLFSLDVESGVRVSSPSDSSDTVSIELVRKYFESVRRGLSD